MAFVIQQDTNLANCRFTVLAKEFQFFSPMSLMFTTTHRPLQYIFIVLVLKVFKRQNTVIFKAFHDVVCSYALLAMKYATLETVRSLGALFVTISTSYWAASAFFDSQQHINESNQIKTGWKIFQIATFR